MSASPSPAMRVDPAEVMPTLLAAFTHDPVARWLYPVDETYERAYPEVVALSAGAAFDAGTIDVAPGGTAIALWVPPRANVDRDELGAAWAAHFQAHVDPARLDHVLAWGEQAEHFHPTEPHWYLAQIAVTPGQQGRGRGTALLRSGLERCDREGSPAYLEASSPRNRALYERHGFEPVAEIRVADSPPIWPMHRPPVGER